MPVGWIIPLSPPILAKDGLFFERTFRSQLDALTLARMSELRLPIVDMSRAHDAAPRTQIARDLDAACREFGFFYLVGHGIDTPSVDALIATAREFFALPVEEKRRIHMSKGGRAWRGFFQLGEELTSGKPDGKEGLYFGIELSEDDPRVKARRPLHGRNLFPSPELASAVLRYIDDVSRVGHAVMSLLAIGLGLVPDFFRTHYTQDPTILFRIFNYPRTTAPDVDLGVGAHTDYGFLTLLKQDTVGGLQVRHGESWLDVPDVPDSFVCNVGDMLERVTRGRYLSALHRVRSSTTRDRMSMALFFDPDFDAVLAPIEHLSAASRPHTNVRWDDIDPHLTRTTYGEYLLSKVGRVFPALRDDALGMK